MTNHLDRPASVTPLVELPRRPRRHPDLGLGDLIPILVVAATVVVAVTTAPRAPHTFDALIHPMALTRGPTGSGATNRVPAVVMPDPRGMPCESTPPTDVTEPPRR
jgi:hypothetical protein